MCVSHRFLRSDPGRGAFSLRPFDGADAEPHGAEEAGDGGRRSTRITAAQVCLRQADGGLLAEVGNQAVGPTPRPRIMTERGVGPIGALQLFSMYPAKLPCPRLRAFNH